MYDTTGTEQAAEQQPRDPELTAQLRCKELSEQGEVEGALTLARSIADADRRDWALHDIVMCVLERDGAPAARELFARIRGEVSDYRGGERRDNIESKFLMHELSAKLNGDAPSDVH